MLLQTICSKYIGQGLIVYFQMYSLPCQSLNLRKIILLPVKRVTCNPRLCKVNFDKIDTHVRKQNLFHGIAWLILSEVHHQQPIRHADCHCHEASQSPGALKDDPLRTLHLNGAGCCWCNLKLPPGMEREKSVWSLSPGRHHCSTHQGFLGFCVLSSFFFFFSCSKLFLFFHFSVSSLIIPNPSTLLTMRSLLLVISICQVRRGSMQIILQEVFRKFYSLWEETGKQHLCISVST